MFLLQDIFAKFHEGGMVMYALAMMAALLWYSLSYRWQALAIPKNYSLEHMDKVFKEIIKDKYDIQGKDDFLSRALIQAKDIVENKPADMNLAIQAKLLSLNTELGQFKKVVASCVMVVPLLGLLGTVIGMIETFDALGDNVLYSQSGGIASGISKALLTTELGLIIAVPGLALSKILEKKEDLISTQITRLAEWLKLYVNSSKENSL